MAALDFSALSKEPTTSLEFKAALSRISLELRRRVQSSPTPASAEHFRCALKALSSIKGVAQAELRISALLDCATYFYLNDLRGEALATTRLLTSLAEKFSNDEWMRSAHHLNGMVLAESGRIADAIISYAVALKHAKKLCNEVSEAKTLINLGAAFSFGSLYTEAIPCLESAIHKTCANPEAVSVHCAALSNLAEAHYFLGSFNRAYDLILQAIRERPEPKDAFASTGLAVRQFIAFKICVERGDLSSAEFHMRACREFANKAGSDRSAFVGQIAEGLLHIYRGHVETGFASLTGLLQQKRGSSGPYYEEALAALVRAYDRADEPELALEHMEMRLQYLARLRTDAFAVIDGFSEGERSELASLQLAESRLRTKVAERSVVRTQLEMFERLAVTADLKEEASGEHGYRVGRLSALLAEQLGWSRDACDAIDLAARLHDIGKIAMPDRILLTSEQLKEAERHLMSTHTLVGAELLAKSNVPQLQMAEEIARFHHEWWNGEGYPARRREKRIPLHARIVALADVFDALTHGRPFAEPWPMDRALEEISNRRGTQFDPELTDLFLELIARLRSEHADLDGYLGKAGASSPFLQARNKIRLMLAERDPEREIAPKAPETVH
jgi:putative two-component system response regulator